MLVIGRDGHYRLVDGRQRPIVPANRFLTSVTARGLSIATVRAYGFDLVTLYRWLEHSRLTLALLSKDKLLQYISSQQVAGAQPATINRRLSTARLLYRFCTGRDLDVAHRIAGSVYALRRRDRQLGLHFMPRRHRIQLRVKVPHRVVEPLTGAEVRAFLRSLRRYRDLAIVHLMLMCGLRSAEVLQLRRGDILVDDGQLRVCGKGDRERVLPLPPVVARAIADYVRWERPSGGSASARLFVILQGKHRGRPMTVAGFRSLFRHRRRDHVVARANPHRFRHTFGADMARSGMRLPILQRLMGHADDATTLRYIQLSMGDIADEYQRAVDKLQHRYRIPR
ncbi:MAG: tyrosine-type recombinase/integrase [Sphingomonadales bacterium]|nr:tyrosine-type recombinase/integrase [Sphingomonadales bacterium]